MGKTLAQRHWRRMPWISSKRRRSVMSINVFTDSESAVAALTCIHVSPQKEVAERRGLNTGTFAAPRSDDDDDEPPAGVKTVKKASVSCLCLFSGSHLHGNDQCIDADLGRALSHPVGSHRASRRKLPSSAPTRRRSSTRMDRVLSAATGWPCSLLTRWLQQHRALWVGPAARAMVW